MKLIFFDEAGYSKSNKDDQNQPFYILAAFIVDATCYTNSLHDFRKHIGTFAPCTGKPPIGLGFEVKASDIVNKKMPWQQDDQGRKATQKST
jgi:hypothetical protein